MSQLRTWTTASGFTAPCSATRSPPSSKSDYCKWELTNPAVNFAISQRGAKPGVDHLGIQVETDAELAEMNARFAAAELPVRAQTGTTCCYARSDKAWTTDPQGVAWETFRTLDAAPVYGHSREQSRPRSSAACCASVKTAATLGSRQ